jgi:hypothetical protein
LILLLLALVLASGAAASPGGARLPAGRRAGNGAAPAANATAAPPALPLRTSGRWLVDAAGARVRLRCASWSGAQEAWFVPSGLWAARRATIARSARAARLNCIRLVWSVEAVLRAANGTAAVPAAAIKANTDLAGKGPLQVLDAVIEAITAEVGRGVAMAGRSGAGPGARGARQACHVMGVLKEARVRLVPSSTRPLYLPPGHAGDPGQPQ